MKRIFIVILLIGFINQLAFAQDFDKAKLDNYFNAVEVNNKFMGSVAVSQNGKIIYTKSVGFSYFEDKVKATENTKYRIGSISKTFTTVLVLKAVEEKKLDLKQTIQKFFPSIQNANKITIQNLLSHRSGIHNFTDDEDYGNWSTTAKTQKEMIDIIATKGSDFDPGSKAQYSNSNFVLLTFILEKTFKTSYAELLTKYISKPLGLTSTYLGRNINLKNNEAKSYSYDEDWKAETETDISIPLGAGGIVSTPVDLVKFSDALFTGKLLKKENLDLMKTIKDNYGAGLFKIPFYERAGYGHTGGIDGFTSAFSHFDDGNISYAMTSNGTNFNNNDISLTVLSAMYGRPYDIPDFKTFEVKSDDLDQYLGVYSSTQMPLKITITKNEKTLIAQATGQSSFELEATEKNKFKFEKAGVVIEFNPKEQTMILKQGGGTYNFTKN